ncbi:RagB/SusD family nutrient uptake outer membrane protein [Chitinophaga caeni]|uniref:RagB/SusD family nutrient uptake outer membrane protein n=2 Tax=Chitinophaga caeni TaxID=2029983 RepID=A0A291R0G4_9BACT|nr:RagB/SusD family nutrient uptake outer membrane protein [Chitinophaga caeni]
MFASCNNFLDVRPSRLVKEDRYWRSIEDARSALIGAYGLSRAALSENAAFWMYGEFRMGDFVATSRTDLKSIINNNLGVSFPLVQKLKNWRAFYAAINSINLFIERSPGIKELDAYYTDINNRLDIAQMRCLRAFLYFYMSRIWGDVPLITSSYDGEFPQFERTPQATVLAFAEKEIVEAALDLPFIYNGTDPQSPGDYYNEGYGRWRGTIFNKISAYSVLAHIAAWQQQYDRVMSYTQFIFDNYDYANISFTNLTENLTKGKDGFFSQSSPSQILNFAFDYQSAEGTLAGHLQEFTLAAPITSKLLPDVYMPRDTILKYFNQPNDERFSIDLTTGYPKTDYYFSNYNTNIPVFSKIKVIEDGGEDKGAFRLNNATLMFTRMEELSLLRAEAAVQTGDRGEAELLVSNVMKSRGIINPSFKGKDMIDEIFAERRRELAGEGWRFFDQIRYQKIKKNNPDMMTLINSGGIYWPIADEVLKSNPKLTQNAYWLN